MTSHGKKCTIKCVRSELMSRYVKPSSESPSTEFFIRIAVADQTTFLLLFLPLSCDLFRHHILFSFTWAFLQTISEVSEIWFHICLWKYSLKQALCLAVSREVINLVYHCLVESWVPRNLFPPYEFHGHCLLYFSINRARLEGEKDSCWLEIDQSGYAAVT